MFSVSNRASRACDGCDTACAGTLARDSATIPAMAENRPHMTVPPRGPLAGRGDLPERISWLTRGDNAAMVVPANESCRGSEQRAALIAQIVCERADERKRPCTKLGLSLGN